MRIEVPNPDGRLKPDMYADVVFHAGADEAPVVAVPASAVIDSGTRQVVLVAKGEGRFEPRPVKLGRRGDGYRRGAARASTSGEEVVTSANFLIDAESNLQGGAEGLHPAGGAEMIAALIRWSARNVFLVGIATRVRDAGRHLRGRRACRSTPFPTSPTCR